jgi:hypothetical protein
MTNYLNICTKVYADNQNNALQHPTASDKEKKKHKESASGPKSAKKHNQSVAKTSLQMNEVLESEEESGTE